MFGGAWVGRVNHEFTTIRCGCLSRIGFAGVRRHMGEDVLEYAGASCLLAKTPDRKG